MNILVTGGAGYIGSVAVKELIASGHEVVVIDNLSKGKKELIPKSVRFYVGDLIDLSFLKRVFSENKFDAVMHFAGYKAVGESMQKPEFYSNNIIGSINLLNLMLQNKVRKIIFSSSAAVYGIPVYTPIDEKHPTSPINYYGFTKLKVEEIINWYSELKGITGINLRYFNLAGDGGLKYIDPDAQNLFPILMEVLSGKRKELVIFGKDYDTPDGTCIRDYIDVNDLVKAHLLALKLNCSETINLGSSKGFSVLGLVKAVEEVSGKKINYRFGPRREGDPAILTASNEKASRLLDWKPERSIKEMVKSTYQAYFERFIPSPTATRTRGTA